MAIRQLYAGAIAFPLKTEAGNPFQSPEELTLKWTNTGASSRKGQLFSRQDAPWIRDGHAELAGRHLGKAQLSLTSAQGSRLQKAGRSVFRSAKSGELVGYMEAQPLNQLRSKKAKEPDGWEPPKLKQCAANEPNLRPRLHFEWPSLQWLDSPE